MMFTTEFYRLADELAAELERVEVAWGKEVVRGWLWRAWAYEMGKAIVDGYVAGFKTSWPRRSWALIDAWYRVKWYLNRTGRPSDGADEWEDDDA